MISPLPRYQGQPPLLPQDGTPPSRPPKGMTTTTNEISDPRAVPNFLRDTSRRVWVLGEGFLVAICSCPDLARAMQTALCFTWLGSPR